MKVVLIVGMLLGTIGCCRIQAQTYSEEIGKLMGRWAVAGAAQLGLAGEDVIIGSKTIRMREGCNTLILAYSLRGEELTATPVTSTLLDCGPKSYPRESLAYAFRHSKYELDGDHLRLTPLSTNSFTLEFRRVR